MSTRSFSRHVLFAKQRPRFVKNMTQAEYHSDKTALGRSQLWKFRQRRRQFEAEVIEGTAPVNGKSKEMDAGTLAHAGLLEPEHFASRYAVFPADVLDARGGETTKAAKEFREAHESKGLIVLKEKELEPVRCMVASVTDTLGSRGWLDVPSRREQAIYWADPATGIRCKALLDWLIVTKHTAYVIDFKTTGDASPDAFRFRCEDHGYWLQDAFYSQGAGLVTNLPVEFLFVVVESKFPFACTVQQFTPDDRRQAEESRARLMANLVQCLTTGDFSEPWEGQLCPISLRPYCYQVAG